VSVPVIRKLFDHLEWADQAVLAALEARPDAPADAFRLAAHMLNAELVWLARIAGETEPPLHDEADLADYRERAARARAGWNDLLGDLAAGRLAAAVAYTNTKGEPFRTALEDILLHVALHGAYHRGQILRIVAGTGQPVPWVDYIAWVRGRAEG